MIATSPFGIFWPVLKIATRDPSSEEAHTGGLLQLYKRLEPSSPPA
jgi:hypothetical protein